MSEFAAKSKKKKSGFVAGEEEQGAAGQAPEKKKGGKLSQDPKFRCRFHENVLPAYEDIVMVQVNQIAEMGAYVSLLEYDGIEGMILLSELSRRRIRSINKLIRVGKNECVSVLRVDREKGYIDLSKRRVSSDQLVAAMERFQKGKAVHSIMRNVAEKLDMPLIELNRMITWPLARSKMFIHPKDAFVLAIQDPDRIFAELKRVSAEYLEQLQVRLAALRQKEASGTGEVLDAGHHQGGKHEEEQEEEEMSAEDMEASIAALKRTLDLPSEIRDKLMSTIKQRLTPQPIKIRADINVSCYSYLGIDAVKTALRCAQKFSLDRHPVTVSLIAPPQYTIQTTALEKNEGIERTKQAVEAVRESIVASGGNMVIKMEPKATTSRDDERLEELLQKMEAENNEIDGDED
eukprot:g2510.t1